MKTVKTMLILALSVASVSLSAQSQKDKSLMKKAEKAKEELLKVDNGLQDFFDDAVGYVIFPNVGKGAFIIGGAAGSGIVYSNGSAIGRADLKKLDIGLQAGGQSIIEVVFFATEEAFNDFKDNDFSFSAGVSAVAVKSGIATQAKYRNGVAVFVLPKAGLMAEASVGGQHFSFKPFLSKRM